MYRSYSYSNMPEPVKTHSAPRREPAPIRSEPSAKPLANRGQSDANIRGCLQNDDIILIIIAAILLINGCDDKLLIIALAYIFLSGRGDNDA